MKLTPNHSRTRASAENAGSNVRAPKTSPKTNHQKARISLADDSGDIEFFKGLSLAVRKGVGFHGHVPLERLTKAAEMLEEGKGVSEVYNRLYEAGKIGPMEPKEFYKFLQRHGLISRKRQKSSRVTKGKKI